MFREGIQIGVVEGIVGVSRYEVNITGAANHAGTTPMNDRRDALFSAARLTQAVREEIVSKPGRQVGNVGFIRASPGVANVISGHVKMPIELRDLDPAVIEDIMERIEQRARRVAEEENVTIDIQLTGQKNRLLPTLPFRMSSKRPPSTAASPPCACPAGPAMTRSSWLGLAFPPA